MSSKWKTIVERNNAKQYSWPKGWSTKEEVAAELECSPERVCQILSPGIRAGEIETQAFPVWDSLTKRVVRLVGYREKPKGEPTSKPAPVDVERLPAGTRVMRKKNKSVGTVQKDGTIHWPSGVVTTPKASQFRQRNLKIVG
jgi:hypothetical protein